MIRVLNYLKLNLPYLVLAYVFVQLIYVLFFQVEYRSDSFYYYKLAQDCLNHNSFYPAKVHLYEDYIVAPLYVNLLVVILNIYNSAASIGILNILLNLLQLFFIYKITFMIFGIDNARLTSVLYILYLNNLGLIITNYTELFFGVLIFISINFYLKENKYSQILAGIFAAASIGVRPLGWALIAAYVLIYLYKIFKKENIFDQFLKMSAGAAVFIILFGLFNHIHFGKFVYTATTGSINILIGANDKATGAFKNIADEGDEAAYIREPESKTYIEKGEIWEEKAYDWIKSHPLKWISLIPVKTGFIFLWDDIAISPLMNLQDWDLLNIVKYFMVNRNFNGFIPGISDTEKIIYLTLQVIHYLYYLFLLFLIISGLIRLKKIKGFSFKISVFILFAIVGILITSMAYGIPRYKYPFIISMLPFAGYRLHLLISAKQERGDASK